MAKTYRPKNYRPDFSPIEEVNPELKDYIEGSITPPKPPSTPFGVIAEAFPALAGFLENLGLPTGGQGLFPASFSHSKIGGDDNLDDLFDEETLASMPRASGPGEAQIADRNGRMHDVYTIGRKLDARQGIQYSPDADPGTVNKLLGG